MVVGVLQGGEQSTERPCVPVLVPPVPIPPRGLERAGCEPYCGSECERGREGSR